MLKARSPPIHPIPPLKHTRLQKHTCGLDYDDCINKWRERKTADGESEAVLRNQ